MSDSTPADPRRHAPSALRNREPILHVLREALPPAGLVLEVASGSGEHAIHFAAALPGLTWQPSDPDAGARASIAAWRKAEGSANLLAPIENDAMAPAGWPLARADAMVCINMVHISPWAATLGLLDGAERILPEGGPLVLYGPYRREGRPLEPGNAAFDEDLKRRNPQWGLRLLETVVAEAEARGLHLQQVTEMPANNLCVVLRKRRSDA